MKQSIPRNAAVAVAQVVVTGVTLFLLYRYILDELGIKQMGVWSVVMATASASRLAQLGLSGGVVRYVAKYLARSDVARAGRIVQTAAISTAVFVAGLAILAYPAFCWLLRFVVPIHEIDQALGLLPFALISLWLTSVVT